MKLFQELKRLFSSQSGSASRYVVSPDYPTIHDPDMPFATLNPLQSCFKDHYVPTKNCVVVSKTGSGKTGIAYIASRYLLDKGERVICLAPTRELVKSLYREAQQVWGAKVVGLNTGSDKSIQGKYVVVSTPEGYLSALRGGREWTRAGLLIVDEAHNLFDDKRGAALDASITLFILAEGKVLLMSGTFPGYEDVARWLKADLFVSNYSKTTLTVHEIHVQDDIEPVPASGNNVTICGYLYNTKSFRIQKLKEILKRHYKESVIIFVPTKATGFCLSESLVLPFHCADIDAEDKDKIVHDFNEGTLKHIIATSTLSQGVNTPADVVVVCGTRRGGYYLEYMDVGQMMGRAGRNKPEALAYLMGDKVELFHAKKMNMVKSLPFPVEELALTVLAKDTITREKLISHFRTTFASFVNRKTSVEEVAGKYLHFLNRCHLLQERAGEYALTREGALIARYYISPKMYMKYITLARTIDACDWSPSLQPEEEERTKGCIILSVLLPYFGQIECPSRLEKDILMRLIPMELEKEVSASKAGTVRHFIQRPSAIPDFLRYQLRDIERWLGMFADFERYQVHEKVPGVIPLKRTFLDLKTAAAKAAAKKKQKAAIKGGT